MKMMLISVVMLTIAAFNTADKLTGRWETKPSSKGNITGIVFKPDNSFEGYINRKPFVSGTYTIQDSIFSFVDNGCDGMKGVYKMIFFNYGDSLRFEPVIDSCNKRREGMSRIILGRINK